MGSTEEGTSELVPVTADDLISYFREVVPLLVGGSEGEVYTALSLPDNIRLLSKFAEDSSVQVAAIQRYVSTEEEPQADDTEGKESTPAFLVQLELQFESSKYAGIVFIKRTSVLSSSKSMASQLAYFVFSDGQPFGTLHTFMHHCITPLLFSAIKVQKADDKLGIKSVKKAATDLETSLLHLQQDTDIPEITLIMPPAIKQAFAKARDERRTCTVTDFQHLVNDAPFLDSLQKAVSRWVKEMQKVTLLDRDPASGTALQEISFWINLEHALQRIKAIRDSPEVTTTLEVLKEGKRFHATTSFDSDTGLQKAIDTVTNYNTLMKDFPINGLLAATDLESIKVAIQEIFLHLKRVRHTKYPVARSQSLVQAISKDVNDQLLKVLHNQGLMHISLADFEKIYQGCNQVFLTWDEQDETFRNLLREIQSKTRDKSIKGIRRKDPEHKALQDRLEMLRKFRRDHEQLRAVIGKVLKTKDDTSEDSDNLMASDDLDAIAEVNRAYDDIKEIDTLDLSEQGLQAWDIAKKGYDQRIDLVETTITERLRDQLGKAKNSSEMFRIFSRFNALFIRPRIRGAIREYQTQLIQNVKEDIATLHNKFKVQYHRTTNSHMSDIRDLPPISGQIIWAKQIDRQLSTYLQRVEAVLGKGWENHVEGRALKEDGDSFRAKLDTEPLFEKWSADIQSRHMNTTGPIFDIELRRGETAQLELLVNFHERLITMAKEVRNLRWLGYRVPFVIINRAKEANRLYPFAISLQASVKTYSQTVEKLRDNPSLKPLVAKWHAALQRRISEGVGLDWGFYALQEYVIRLAEESEIFQDKVDDLIATHVKLTQLLESLETIPYANHEFKSVITQMQDLVHQLRDQNYVNLPAWLKDFDHHVENRLLRRLTNALANWSAALEQSNVENKDWDDGDENAKKDLPEIKSMRHEIQVRNQVMVLNPPWQSARQNLLHQLQEYVAIVTDLPRLHLTRPDETNGHELTLTSGAKYSTLLCRLPSSGEALLKAYGLIEKQLAKVTAYVQQWFAYQALWDLQMDNIVQRFGDNLNKWQQLLLDISAARRHFDTSEISKRFGPVHIDYAQVQTRVSMKYDAIHKDILARFGARMGDRTLAFFKSIHSAREKLETLSIESANTNDSIGFIGFIQGNKRTLEEYGSLMETFRSGQKILERQRYAFPQDWLSLEQLESEWDAFNAILKRRDTSIQGQVASLQMRVVNEERSVEARITELILDWDRKKPMSGDQNPDEAINLLNIFEGQFTRLKDDYDNLCKAKSALDLEIKADDRLSSRMEELLELKGSWAELSRTVAKIDELKHTPWGAVVPTKVRNQLNDILEEMKNMPARVKSYQAYEFLRESVRSYIKMNETVSVLRGDTLKDRHWKIMMKNLGVKWILADLTLGQVWEADLVTNEKKFSEVMLQAQGEKALEEFLKQIREVWQTYELELVNYQNKTQLIKGWDDLFTQAKDHINNLAQMKLSPYYKVFEEEATNWDQKLNMLYNLFYDIWIDVQRQWVYLEGIFSGSADLKVLLPNETNKFQALSNDFMGLMKKVHKAPIVLDVLAIPNLQKTLEHLKDVLDKIQKALSKYLEQERASFPRFYFVGDEDLLDIIGNGKNVDRIQKHFRKMFAGLHRITIPEDGSYCTGFESKEGEQVPYTGKVQIQGQKINTWLTQVEKDMKTSLASLLKDSVTVVNKFRTEGFKLAPYMAWLEQFQAQLVVLSTQVSWSESAEAALSTIERGGDSGPLKALLTSVLDTLTALADAVLLHQPPIRRKKLEQMITELVHKRDVTREIINSSVSSPNDFQWKALMRFNFDYENTNVLQQLTINMADSTTFYGFEYLGLVEKLVQTPLTDRCFQTLMQALQARQGGAPFGPAGTGKTESVKALGAQLGRFVLVFNCDETFDNHAMGRIFVGLCQVGAWGCFDEFNRLEENMLSAVSQQIETIQLALKAGVGKTGEELKRAMTVVLQGRTVPVNQDIAIFITMNPGYAGRSPLPDNLKKLFRNMAMTKPDRQLIAQVMLYSQGFRTAELLSRKVNPLFILCSEQLSAQSHYDFGLRSLKSVLVSAGNIKRDRLTALREAAIAAGEELDEEKISKMINEQEVVIQSITQTMIPKLVAQDIPLLDSLLADVFPGVKPPEIPLEELKAEIVKICNERHYVVGEMFMTKILQLYQVTTLNHGLMLVGPSGVGKSVAWRVLLDALRRIEKKDAQSYVLDPKAITKDELYGFLDPTTREWTDGLFTHIVRKIIDNVRGELDRRQWIIFDGDVDPEWVENLNSVLDDNKLLTLPNGERLSLPPNIRIIFEVQDLRNATLATVSRCGMVWFSEEVLSLDMYFSRFLNIMRNEYSDEEGGKSESEIQAALGVQKQVADALADFFASDGAVTQTLAFARDLFHIMDYTETRCINALFSMLKGIPRAIVEQNAKGISAMSASQVEGYARKRFVYALIWSIVGDTKGSIRQRLSDFVRTVISGVQLPADGEVIIDYKVTLPDGDWQPWSAQVPRIELDSGKVSGTDTVVPTLDTVRHEDLLYTWLSEHLPIVLCGPPGSGKTMTLFSALRALPHFEVAGLNFSSTTTPDLIMKTFDQYCEYRRTANGVVLAPTQLNKWLVIFMDECNLAAADKYNTVRVITFVRQLVEQGGFWRTEDHSWITLERIQFVGACNPPTDPGRVPLAQRFLRHIPVVYVDYPGAESLKQIYGTFNRAILRQLPALTNAADALTDAMVDFYMQSQNRFTADMQPHYIYSPREMTRWVKGVGEAISPHVAGNTLDLDGLCRIWAHEALRLFQDRLVFEEERVWTDEKVNEVARAHFVGADFEKALARPILFSDWISKTYGPVDPVDLRGFITEKLKSFTEEQLNLKLVLFDEVLDHVLRIDRVFRQNQGHMLLIGISGCGRTTLARFVAWMNGLSVVQVKTHALYTANDFDADLRDVLRRSGVDGEKIVFIMDEGNIMDTAFLERMNTLLANGEVPGLFEGDEYSALMTKCKEASRRQNKMLDDNDELYKWFSKNVMNNLHIVFTMCPAEGGMNADDAAASPALFNRCVLDWFGDWSEGALYRVGQEFTDTIPMEKPDWVAPSAFPSAFSRLPDTPNFREAVANACVYTHKSVLQAARRMQKREGRSTHITPRHYIEFLKLFAKFYDEKRKGLEAQRDHLSSGVIKIEETVKQVEEMQGTLSEKRAKLEEKDVLANAKLQQMLKDQSAAEEKKKESLKIENELKIKQAAADERKRQAEAELAGVEPAVQEAKAAVEGIKKKDLQELKALGNPPNAVKLALEGTLTLIGQRTTDWKNIRAIIVQDSFIPTITNFNSELITAKIVQLMEKEYVANPDFSFEKANRASQAAGPLVKWALAQMAYATMLTKIEPLRNELKRLEEEARQMQLQQQEIQALVMELEESIRKYKEEYAVLISEKEAIKADLTQVSDRVERSIKLLDSLSSEKERWSKGSEDFANQMSTLIGDCITASAFVAYSGYFDQAYRQQLLGKWVTHLSKAKIDFKPGVDDGIPEYLSTPDDRLRWKNNGLPEDDLCVQNAIMLKRTERFPLVIDPAGQATHFILNEYKTKNMKVTSFLNSEQFRKDLEAALRFGTSLLIQDAESFDPLLNPVLNREERRKSGRLLITIGDKEIDLAPNITIILTTRNPLVQFKQDLCSRVSLINFTVTRGSLQTQCLNQALRAERPDVDSKRSDLLKLQGEFRLRLLQLENELLQALNEAEGSILDDNKVIAKLETLKKESSEVLAKVAETDIIMAEVEQVSKGYLPLAVKCSSIFFTLQQLSSVHFLYQYSLQFFLDIFRNVLHGNEHLVGVDDYGKRLAIITRDLFQVVYDRVAPGMLHEHRMPLAVTFAKFQVAGTPDEFPDAELDFLLAGAGFPTDKSDFAFLVPNVLTDEQSQGMHALAHQLPVFKKLKDDVKANQAEFEAWAKSARPESKFPSFANTIDGAENKSKIIRSFRQLILLNVVRPDRVLSKTHILVDEILGKGFASSSKEGELLEVVEKQIDAKTPMLLCGVKGFDTSVKVDDLASVLNKQVTSIAVGSGEAKKEAEAALQATASSGKWLMLKNVHLAPDLLVTVEKRLSSMTPHPSFRLFLTTEINPKLPVNLLRAARVFVYEPAAGVKAAIKRTLQNFPPKIDQGPKERGFVYLLLAWLHAVTQERLRYAPLGWSKRYEFGEPDLRNATDTIDKWMDSVGSGKDSVDPSEIPWAAMRKLLAQSVYGGRIDNEIDQRLFDAFISTIFSEKSFLSKFCFVEQDKSTDTPSIKPPTSFTRTELLSWADSLPDSQSPTWLGLPSNAEMVLLASRAKTLLVNTMKLQTVDDDSASSSQQDAGEDEAASAASSLEQPKWMSQLAATATKWLQVLPERLSVLPRSADSIKDPLFRFYDREVGIGIKLLGIVRADLNEVLKACRGEVKQTNYLRALMADLVQGSIFKTWKLYKVPDGLPVNQWVIDLAQRVKQLQSIADMVTRGTDLRSMRVWMGGLFVPEAYVTATRQAVAQANGWALERLTLELDVRPSETDTGKIDNKCFLATNLRLEGATCHETTIELVDVPFTTLPLTVLRWKYVSEEEEAKKAAAVSTTVGVPLYLNATRSDLIAVVEFKPQKGSENTTYYRRAVAMTCSSLSGVIA